MKPIGSGKNFLPLMNLQAIITRLHAFELQLMILLKILVTKKFTREQEVAMPVNRHNLSKTSTICVILIVK